MSNLVGSLLILTAVGLLAGAHPGLGLCSADDWTAGELARLCASGCRLH